MAILTAKLAWEHPHYKAVLDRIFSMYRRNREQNGGFFRE